MKTNQRNALEPDVAIQINENDCQKKFNSRNNSKFNAVIVFNHFSIVYNLSYITAFYLLKISKIEIFNAYKSNDRIRAGCEKRSILCGNNDLLLLFSAQPPPPPLHT